MNMKIYFPKIWFFVVTKPRNVSTFENYVKFHYLYGLSPLMWFDNMQFIINNDVEQGDVLISALMNKKKKNYNLHRKEKKKP